MVAGRRRRLTYVAEVFRNRTLPEQHYNVPHLWAGKRHANSDLAGGLLIGVRDWVDLFQDALQVLAIAARRIRALARARARLRFTSRRASCRMAASLYNSIPANGKEYLIMHFHR